MDYQEETIFQKTYEQLADHQLIVSFTMRQPWGSGLAELSVAQFVQEADKYNVGAFGSINVRLFRGLSVNTYASLNRTQDQIYLPSEGATTEEILLRQQQLATSYRYTVTLGLTYSFGSIFNNIVNPLQLDFFPPSSATPARVLTQSESKSASPSPTCSQARA